MASRATSSSTCNKASSSSYEQTSVSVNEQVETSTKVTVDLSDIISKATHVLDILDNRMEAPINDLKRLKFPESNYSVSRSGLKDDDSGDLNSHKHGVSPKRVAELSAIVGKLRADNRTLEVELEELGKQLQQHGETEHHLLEHQRRISELEAGRLQAEKELRRAREEARQLEDEKADLKAKLDLMSSKMEGKKLDVAAEVQRVHEEMAALRKETAQQIRDARDKTEQAENEAHAARAELTNTKDKLGQTTAALHQSEERYLEVKRQLEELQLSQLSRSVSPAPGLKIPSGRSSARSSASSERSSPVPIGNMFNGMKKGNDTHSAIAKVVRRLSGEFSFPDGFVEFVDGSKYKVNGNVVNIMLRGGGGSGPLVRTGGGWVPLEQYVKHSFTHHSAHDQSVKWSKHHTQENTQFKKKNAKITKVKKISASSSSTKTTDASSSSESKETTSHSAEGDAAKSS